MEASWKDESLSESLRESMKLIKAYTRRFSGIPESILNHTSFLLEATVRANDMNGISEISIFTELLQWFYYHLDPEETERSGIR